MSDLRFLPSVHSVLTELGKDGEGAAAAGIIREVLQKFRERIEAGESAPAHDAVVEAARTSIQSAGTPPLRRIINASGVVLQTNLGRAPLDSAALDDVDEAAKGYSNLEFDLESGGRGNRHEHLRSRLRRVTGAQDGMVVNNNAAGLFMALHVFARGRDVIVSRGQAVEIGGGFRIPDVIGESGARLVEVGTTNRTYRTDFSAAVTSDTAAILRVHSSNFRVVGFTTEPTLKELRQESEDAEILLIDDLGSGCLIDTTEFGMAPEPTVQESLTAGADLVLFSGDKLLGGPQAGIIVGRAALIEELRGHPLARALRIDKLTTAALAATLKAYEEGEAASRVPVWRMLSTPLEDIRARADRIAGKIAGSMVVTGTTMVGGGSLPGEGMPTYCVAISSTEGPERLSQAMRSGDVPIVARIEDERVLIDPRTMDVADDDLLVRLVRAALPNSS